MQALNLNIIAVQKSASATTATVPMKKRVKQLEDNYKHMHSELINNAK